MSIRIEYANNTQTLRAVFGFRYRVYVSEMARTQNDADHQREQIRDKLDDDGVILAAWQNGEVVATVRNNVLGDEAVASYRHLYQIEEDQAADQAIAVTTRLMVKASLRKTTLATRMCMEIYRDALARAVEIGYLDCNDHLVPYFLGLGYEIHKERVAHPEYGRVTVMRLELRNLRHLETIRSPFRRILSGVLSDAFNSSDAPALAG